MSTARIDHILCPTDFSPFSGQALRHAIALTQSFHAHLKVIHVIPEVFLRGESVYASDSWILTPDVRQAVEAEMQRFLQPARDAGIDHETEIRSGTPWTEILVAAKEKPSDLVVLGSHGHGGLHRLVLGSVAEKLIRSLPCAVMSVRHEGGPTSLTPGRIAHILCATDFSETSNQTFETAIAIASRNGAKVTLLHVIERFPDVKAVEYGALGADPSNPGLERHAVERLQQLIASVDARGVEIEPKAKVGRAYKEILTMAATEPTDLIMIGAQGHGVIEHLLFGSNAHHVVRAATCPVLTVRMRSKDDDGARTEA
ncbi:MAG: universal stress protein [Vicinamibacteria bacterium]